MESVSFWVFNPCGSKKAGNSQGTRFRTPHGVPQFHGYSGECGGGPGGMFQAFVHALADAFGCVSKFQNPK